MHLNKAIITLMLEIIGSSGYALAGSDIPLITRDTLVIKKIQIEQPQAEENTGILNNSTEFMSIASKETNNTSEINETQKQTNNIVLAVQDKKQNITTTEPEPQKITSEQVSEQNTAEIEKQETKTEQQSTATATQNSGLNNQETKTISKEQPAEFSQKLKQTKGKDPKKDYKNKIKLQKVNNLELKERPTYVETLYNPKKPPQAHHQKADHKQNDLTLKEEPIGKLERTERGVLISRKSNSAGYIEDRITALSISRPITVYRRITPELPVNNNQDLQRTSDNPNARLSNLKPKPGISQEFKQPPEVNRSEKTKIPDLDKLIRE